MTEAAPDPTAVPVWARETAFPEAPTGWGWVDPKDGRFPCGSLEALEKAIIDDTRGKICLVWTPGNPRMVLPEEVAGLNQAVLKSRSRWIAADNEEYRSKLNRALTFFAILLAWVFYKGYTHQPDPKLPTIDRAHLALSHTLNDSVIEIGFLLLVIFIIIPWYQARKRSAEFGKFTTPEGLAGAIPAMRFEIWLERQKAPFTKIFLGLITLVGIAQLQPNDATKAAGLVKSAYAQGDWWRLFTAPFLHGNPIHFAMNAAALLYLGKRLEVFARWPHLPLVFLFAACIGGQTSVYFVRDVTSVGASGGLMGWLGFLLVFETLHSRLVPRSSRRRLAGAVFLTALIGVLGHQFIDNAAHAGGLIAGMLYAVIVFPKSSSAYRPQTTMTDLAVGSLALAASIFCAGFAIWKICGAH